jgi:hypothetical protein
LPERQILEHEVDAPCELRAQYAQESECEGHCSRWLARRSLIVQSRGCALANDKSRQRGPARVARRLLRGIRFRSPLSPSRTHGPFASETLDTLRSCSI